MASATDIITYIGVPLAVLGVLPILYTFVLAIFSRRRIRSLLIHHGHKPMRSTRKNDGFMIRSSPMTNLIEVELPRYTIAPLERQDERYWRTADDGHEGHEEHHRLLDRSQTTLSMIEEGRVSGYLRGGSWRAFNWKKLIVGRRLYRIQYEDELREPPAEMDFADLVLFLLDWGAMPDSMGWEKLKTGGLWTPAGTVLLRRPVEDDEKNGDWVLRTNMPDESDGILSLTIRWPNSDDKVAETRGAESLPPGWGRLLQPQSLQVQEKTNPERRDLPARFEELKSSNKYAIGCNSIRFSASDNTIKTLRWEQHETETGFISEPFHPAVVPSTGAWFSSAVAALLSHDGASSLWNFTVPPEISEFCRRESVPCGVLVHLGMLDEASAPSWSTEPKSFGNSSMDHMNNFIADNNARKLEATMPPAQAQVAKANREAAMRRRMMDDMHQRQREQEERRDRRLRDAVASPKVSNKAAAEACLAWLIQQGDIGREYTVEQLAQAVLYLIILDTSEDGQAAKVIMLLDEWMEWCNAGGMKMRQVEDLERRRVEFCYAAALVSTIASGSVSSQGKAGKDMLDCLKTWRKIRLG